MVSVTMKMFQNKMISQKTNDTKARSLFDYIISSNGVETIEALLFGYLLGLQPKTASVVSPGNNPIDIITMIRDGRLSFLMLCLYVYICIGWSVSYRSNCS